MIYSADASLTASDVSELFFQLRQKQLMVSHPGLLDSSLTDNTAMGVVGVVLNHFRIWALWGLSNKDCSWQGREK